MADQLPDPRVLQIFSRGEAFDAEGFADLFSEAPIYQFGAAPIARNRKSIRKSVRDFFGLVHALYHDIKTVTVDGNIAFVEMDVHYWRKTGGHVRLPCLDIVRLNNAGKITELRIGMDAAAVADASVEVPDDASVFVTAKGEAFHPHPMRRYFSETEDGRARAKSHPPRWSIAGPEWTIDDASGASGL